MTTSALAPAAELLTFDSAGQHSPTALRSLAAAVVLAVGRMSMVAMLGSTASKVN
jgi:hypothetical protein